MKYLLAQVQIIMFMPSPSLYVPLEEVEDALLLECTRLILFYIGMAPIHQF
jgi:hypothetical protein